MGWLGNLIDRIDAKLDRPADQTALTDPTKRRSMRMIDQMKHDERRPYGSGEEQPKVRTTPSEGSSRRRWIGR